MKYKVNAGLWRMTLPVFDRGALCGIAAAFLRVGK